MHIYIHIYISLSLSIYPLFMLSNGYQQSQQIKALELPWLPSNLAGVRGGVGVKGLGLRVTGLEFRVWGWGFRV